MQRPDLSTTRIVRLLANVMFLLLCLVSPLNIELFKALSFAVLVILCLVGIQLTLKRPALLADSAFGASLVLVFILVWAIDHSQTGGLDLVWLIRYVSIIFVLPICREKLQQMTPTYFAVVVVIVAHFLGNAYCIAAGKGMYLNGAHRYFGLSDGMIVVSGLINFLCIIYCCIILPPLRGARKLMFYGPVLLALFNIFVTSTRSTLLATVLFGLFYFRVSLKISRIIAIAVGLASAVFIIATYAPESMERFATIADFSEGSNLSRIQFIISGINMFAEHPIAGVGAGASHILLERYVPWEESPAMHFDLLLIAAELGFCGVAAFAWLLAKMRLLRPFLLVIILLLTTQNMFYYAAYFMLILLGLAAATLDVRSRERSSGMGNVQVRIAK